MKLSLGPLDQPAIDLESVDSNMVPTDLSDEEKSEFLDIFVGLWRFKDHPEYDEVDVEVNLFEKRDPVDFDQAKAEIIWNQILCGFSSNHVDEVKLSLTPEEEKTLFLQFHYRKRQMCIHIGRARAKRASRNTVLQVIDLHRKIIELRNMIFVSNMGLVIFVAKRMEITTRYNGSDMINEAWKAVYDSIELFDLKQGNKFSTYATTAIIKKFHRCIGKDIRHDHNCVSEDVMSGPDASYYYNSRHTDLEEQEKMCALKDMHRVWKKNDAKLSKMERKVLKWRFLLDAPYTLEKCGIKLGRTKERIRQMQNKALEKMRKVMEGKDAEPRPHQDADHEDVLDCLLNYDTSALSRKELNMAMDYFRFNMSVHDLAKKMKTNSKNIRNALDRIMNKLYEYDE